MPASSYLMVAVLVGSLAAIVYIQQERIIPDGFWRGLLYRETKVRGENAGKDFRRTSDEAFGKKRENCDASLAKTPCEKPTQFGNKLESKQLQPDHDCCEAGGAIPSPKEQHIEEQNRKKDDTERNTANDNINNDAFWGHNKKLGEHGSSIIEGEIEELSFVPSGKDFYEHFLRKRRPLVMRGGIKDWPAVKHWANESYLRQNYGDVIFDIQLTKKYEGEFPVKKTMSLSEFLQIYKSKQVYLDCPFPHSDMIQDIFVPYCLQCDEVMPTIASTHLLFSSGNTSSSCHMDGYENLLSLIAGTKEVLVADPQYIEYFYPRNHTTVNIESPIDPEGVDLNRFPKLAEIPFHKVVLKAGDILYIPQHWWHHVRSFDCPNIAISLWFHPFPERDDDNVGEDDDADLFEDIIQSTKSFDKLVKTYPETIECRSQNKPITEAFRPRDDAWDTPRVVNTEDSFVTLNSGHNMPKMGFGTAGLFGDTKSATLAALKAGYRLIDSAQAYDEELVGEAVKESGMPHEEVFIVSKVHPRFLSYHETLKSVEDSLAKLKVDYIDLMLIHSMDCDEGPGAHLVCQKGEPKGTWENSWKALESLVDSGKIRSIGVSNFEVQDLQRLLEIATIRPSVLQNFFDPFYQDREVREFCERHQIQYMGYSPLGDSWISEGLNSNPVLSDEGLRKIASKFDASIPQVVLKWSLENNVISIPRSRNPNHIETNFQLSHVLLSEQDREYLANLDRKIMIPDEGPPYDTRSKPSTSDQATEAPPFDDRSKPSTSDQATEAPPYDTRSKPSTSDQATEAPPFDARTEPSTSDQATEAPPFDARTEPSTSDQATEAPPCDDRSKPSTSDQANAEEKPEEPQENIDGEVVLEETVDPNESTVYLSSDDHWIYAFDSTTGKLKWKVGTADEGGSKCAFSESGAVVYCGTDDKSIRALSVADGSLIWKFSTGGAVTSSTRIAEDGTLYVGCLDGYFYAINPDGSLKWKKNLTEEIWSSPALLEGGRVIFIGTMAEESPNVYSLDGQTGDVIWKYETGGPVFSSPAVSPDGKAVFFCSFDANCYAFDVVSGQQLWELQGDSSFQSSPAVSQVDGTLYVGSSGGNIYAVDSSTGTTKWIREGKGELMSSPFIAPDGKIYIGSGEGEVLCLKQTDGSVVWSFKTGSSIWSSPRLDKSGLLFIGGIDTYMYALRTDNGQFVWKYKTGGPVVGTPLITREHAVQQA